ncbi:MAG TPA: MBL fold metallo-hydrolase [bacterium]|nr:MBL fold metallo-hydrolase [bacterium]
MSRELAIDWQPLPGQPAGRWLPLVVPQTLESCNSFLIDSGGVLLLIDPWLGHPRLRQELAERPPDRPLLLCYSHCHLDHLNCGAYADETLAASALTLIHTAGAAALAAADRDLTQAALFDQTLAPITVGGELFRAADRPGTERTVVLRTGEPLTIRTLADPAWPTPVQDLLFGVRTVARIYHAPGHSPDSIIIRAGNVLFGGDLLHAAHPMVAGIVGHNQADFVATLTALRGLVAAAGIELFAPGHGPLLPTARLAGRLARITEQAAGHHPRRFDAVRRDQLLAEGLTIAEELRELLALIGGRLLVAALTLRELDEPELADRLEREFDPQTVNLTFAEFAADVDRLRAGDALPLIVLHRLAKLMHQLGAFFTAGPLERVLDPVLLLRARRLLTDFLLISHGHNLPDERAAVALRDLLAQAFLPDPGLDALLDAADDPAAFSAELARRLVSQPGNRPVATLALPDTLPAVLVDRERLLDALLTFVREMPAATRLTVTVACTAAATVTIRWSGPNVLSDPAIAALSRCCAAAGAEFTVTDGQTVRLVCPIASPAT